MFRLDIFSDPVCPWCLIGKANLDRALEAHPDHPFAIEWHPFQLNPEMEPGGVDKNDYLAARFGGPDKLVAIQTRLREFAVKAGVDLDPDVPKRIPNTLDAHRLIHWAGLEGRQHLLVSALFRAYWMEGLDIGDAWAHCAFWQATPIPMISPPATATPAPKASAPCQLFLSRSNMLSRAHKAPRFGIR